MINEGELFTDGKTTYVITEKWGRGFEIVRIVFENKYTGFSFEKPYKEFLEALETGKIKRK